MNFAMDETVILLLKYVPFIQYGAETNSTIPLCNWAFTNPTHQRL
jgi:hypothetical protein